MRSRPEVGLRMSKALAAALCAVVFGAPAAASDRETGRFDLDRYGFDYWSETQGLPQASVRAILQTRDGFLWMGTTGGLVRFDGVTFERHGVGQLQDNEVRTLVEDERGRLWIGTFGGGISIYERGRVSSLTTAEGLPHDVVRRLALDGEGAMWAATEKGLVRIHDDALTPYPIPGAAPGAAIADLCVSSDGVLFVATRSGLHRRTARGFETVPGVVGEDDGHIFTLAPGTDGTVWVGFDTGTVKRHDEDGTRPMRGAHGSDTVYHIHEDPGGAVWVASQLGVARLGPDGFEAIEPSHGSFSLSPARAFLSDGEGSLWIATEKGLARMRAKPFTTVSTDDGLVDDSVRAVLEDDAGSIWIGTHTGLSRWRDGRVERMTMDGKDIPAASLALGPGGEVWIATGRQLLVHRNGRTAPLPDWPPPAASIRVLASDGDGRLWVGTVSDGLRVIDRGSVRVLKTADGLCSNAIRHVLPDGRGGAFISTFGGGTCHYRAGRFTSIPEMQSMGLSHALHSLIDEAGALWIATRGGLLRIKDGRQARLTEREGLLSSFLYSMVDDGRGRFWFACALGLFSVEKAQLDAAADKRSDRVTSVAYGIRDGMKSNVCTVAVQPSAARTRDGRLLFATLGGMVVVHLDRLRPDMSAPPVALASVHINGEAFDAGEPAEVPPGDGTVEIRYAALSYVAPETASFRYRLEGMDKNWIEAGGRRFAHYANLPAGEYVFRVTAARRNGTWNPEAASYRFRLKPHLYETAGFRALLGVIAVASVFGLLQVQAWRSRRREHHLQRRIAEAVAQVKVLTGMLPICSACKKIRDDTGYWANLETYISEHTEADFSHGICPECVVSLYPEYAARLAGAVEARDEAAGASTPGHGPATQETMHPSRR